MKPLGAILWGLLLALPCAVLGQGGGAEPALSAEQVMALAPAGAPAPGSLPLADLLAGLEADPAGIGSMPSRCRAALARGGKMGAGPGRQAAPLPSELFAAFAAVADTDEGEAIANEWVAIAYGRFKQMSDSSPEGALERQEAEADYRQRLAEREALRLQQRESREELARLMGRPLSALGRIDASSLEDLAVAENLLAVDAAANPRLQVTLGRLEPLGRLSGCKAVAERLAGLAREGAARQLERARSRWEYDKSVLLPAAEARLKGAELRLVRAREAAEEGQRPALLAVRSTELAEAQRQVRALRAAIQVSRLRYLEWAEGRRLPVAPSPVAEGGNP
ncbi:MAG: hypothetical protein H6R10_3347 [Rhodocyclaceae bacterium]|nr:hypothetical protein [Rhodocyclaceae bacterium]